MARRRQTAPRVAGRARRDDALAVLRTWPRALARLWIEDLMPWNEITKGITHHCDPLPVPERVGQIIECTECGLRFTAQQVPPYVDPSGLEWRRDN